MARKRIRVGCVSIGGGAPVSVQSMTTTDTRDVAGTASQIRRLADAGCELVRVAVPDMAAARAVGQLKNRVPVPIVADIHFDYKLAVTAAEAGADKNPDQSGQYRRRHERARRYGGLPEKGHTHPHPASTAEAWRRIYWPNTAA
jgi:4-hydroxy-3-methylbut-2-en-1-yl diphosphate synthase IspG/GcpE